MSHIWEIGYRDGFLGEPYKNHWHPDYDDGFRAGRAEIQERNSIPNLLAKENYA